MIRSASMVAILGAMLASCETSPTEPRIAPLVKPKPAPSVVLETPQPSAKPTVPLGQVTRIAIGDLFAKQQSGEVLIYDVRPAFYYKFGRIQGAINWPKSQFSPQLAAREIEIQNAKASGKSIVLYCTDLACPDAREVASRLAKVGHSTQVLEGGWEAWKAGGLPTE